MALLGGATIVCLPFAHAQQPKVYRVGLLDYSPAEVSRMRLWQAFRQQLGELGYVEGQDIAFEPRWADGHADRLPGLAADLVKLKVDVIVTAGTVSAVAAGQATATIPIVMTTGSGPRELRLVTSLAKPSGNVTGVTTLTAELSGKRLELVREVVPQGSRLGSLFDPGNQGSVFGDQATQTAAQSSDCRFNLSKRLARMSSQVFFPRSPGSGLPAYSFKQARCSLQKGRDWPTWQ